VEITGPSIYKAVGVKIFVKKNGDAKGEVNEPKPKNRPKYLMAGLCKFSLR
jgi:hypothetical protein